MGHHSAAEGGHAADGGYQPPPWDACPPGRPPTCPFHCTFLPRSAPTSDLAVMEIAEQSILFFVGSVHHIEICKGDNVDAGRRSPSPCRALPPRCARPRCGISSRIAKK